MASQRWGEFLMDRMFDECAAKKRKTTFNSALKRATEINGKLWQLYARRDLSCIAWFKMVEADVGADKSDPIDVMGRPLTQQIADFIVKPLRRVIGRRMASKIKYITGLPGCGKTVSVLDAVGHLHVESMKALKQAEALKQEVLMEKQEAAALNEVSRRRFAYLSGVHFVADPKETLYKALIMAFVNDPQVLETLSNLDYEGDGEIRAFISECRRQLFQLHVVLDVGNAMDQKKKLSSKENEKRSAASLFFDTIVGSADFTMCASIRKLRRVLESRPNVQFLLVRGGFNDSELSTYLSFYKKKKTDLDYSITGNVPRLLSCYLDDMGEFGVFSAALDNALDGFMKNAKGKIFMKVLVAAAGGPMEELSQVMDTRCFIRGTDGNAVCLTDRLRARAIGRAEQYANHIPSHRVRHQLEKLTQLVSIQDTSVAIGWTAEAAAILSLRLREPVIELQKGLDIKITPRAVTVFKGRLTKAKVARGARTATLYIPLVFNHKGADVYYVDLQFLVVGQITVGADHPSTYVVAKSLFEGDSRIKVILWVVVQTDEQPVITLPNEEKDYYEVFMPFGKLDSALSLIDEKVKQVRRPNPCSECGLERDAGEQVECTKCSCWFHVACTNYQGDDHWKCNSCEHADGGDGSTDEDTDDEDYEVCDEYGAAVSLC